MKLWRVVMGLVFWVGCLGALAAAVGGPGASAAGAGRRYLGDLWGYYARGPKLELRLPEGCDLDPGDPVFTADGQGMLRQVGLVVSRSGEGPASRAQVVLFRSAPELGRPVKAYYLDTPAAITWVIQTLLPPERRRQVESELAAAFQEHQDEILQALQPVVQRSARDALAVLQHDLPRALEKHRPELQALAARDQEEVLRRELGPLVKDTVWPLVRKDGEAVFRQVSTELWERLSLWRFAWRGLADRMPLVRRRDRVEAELQRFLEEEVAPILERHQEDFLAVLQNVVRDAAGDAKVQAALQQGFTRAVEDPELRRVLNAILQEAVVRNPHLWEAVRRGLNSPEAREALQLAGSRLEPAVRRIGDLVLGTREGGLTPEFTQVLRQQILLKDRQGILVGDLPATDPALPCTPLEAWFSK